MTVSEIESKATVINWITTEPENVELECYTPGDEPYLELWDSWGNFNWR